MEGCCDQDGRPSQRTRRVKKIIENLHEDYRKHLRFLPLSNYRSLYEVGVNIEDYMMKENPTNNNGGWKGKKDTPSSSKPNYSNNNNVNDVWAVDNQRSLTERERREFTPIGMSYDTTFDRLQSRGLITPIGPIRTPNLKNTRLRGTPMPIANTIKEGDTPLKIVGSNSRPHRHQQTTVITGKREAKHQYLTII